MARRNRSAADSDPQAFDGHTPSSPSRPPVVTIYCSRADREDKILITSWATWVGAASFLEALIADQEGEPKWLKHKLGRWTQLVWPSGLTVTTRSDDSLERLVEQETSWELPEPYLGEIRQFLGDQGSIEVKNNREIADRTVELAKSRAGVLRAGVLGLVAPTPMMRNKALLWLSDRMRNADQFYKQSLEVVKLGGRDIDLHLLAIAHENRLIILWASQCMGLVELSEEFDRVITMSDDDRELLRRAQTLAQEQTRPSDAS